MGDYSFIANAPTPMENLGKIAATQNAINENRLFVGRQAAGAALQAATGPDGQVDFARAAALIGQNPRVAPYAMEALNKLLTNQGQSISNTSSQQKLAEAYSSAIRNDVVAAHAAGEDPISVIARRAATGAYPLDFASRFIGGSALSDGSTFDKLAKESAVANGTEAGMEAEFGKATTEDVGGQSVGLNVNRVTGQRDVMGGNAAVIKKTLSPSEAVTPAFEQFNPATQQKEIVTKGAASAAGAGNAGAKPIPAEAPLGAEAAANTAGSGSSAILNADLSAQNGALDRITALKKVNDLLATPEGGTGPGTKVTNAWRSFLLANAEWATHFLPGGIDKAKIQTATQDELHKYLTQIAGNAAAQFGQGTNEKLAIAASGNPNADISTLANRDVTRLMLALERAKQARMAGWSDSGQPPQNYGAYVANWNRTHDARAFLLDQLTPKERAKMLSTINSDADKKALLRGKKAAEDAGLFAERDIPR